MNPEKNINGDAPTNLDNLHGDNQLRKIKLKEEYGIDFHQPKQSPDLPAEIENEFLKNIENFEQAYMENKQIPLYDFIGKPEFIKADSIPDREINAALNGIMETLDRNQIGIDSICGIEEREMYRFITEELFAHEIDDIRIPGMILCFIYEEFHPNHDYDIRDHSTAFVTSFFNKDSDYHANFITRKGKADEFLNNFRNSYESFSLAEFVINTVNFNETNAIVNFQIDFSGTIAGDGEKQIFKGEGEIELVNTYNYWCVEKITFPKKSNHKEK